MLNEQASLREKMVLFWHNHFVTALGTIGDPRYGFRYNALLRKYALGNFKELALAITIDGAMLKYLNGNRNSKAAPDENYARELQELFTIGKGPEIGPGDYTNYTEDDVKAAAKVLTGWRLNPNSDGSIGSANSHVRSSPARYIEQNIFHSLSKHDRQRPNDRWSDGIERPPGYDFRTAGNSPIHLPKTVSLVCVLCYR